VQDILNTKKFGDIAFRDKDFKNAIEYYSKVDSLLHNLLQVFGGASTRSYSECPLFVCIKTVGGYDVCSFCYCVCKESVLLLDE